MSRWTARGCVIVDQYLNPPGHPEIFVCGDLAHVEENGKQVPGVAQPAMQMGTYAAKRIDAVARPIWKAGRANPSTTSTRATWPPSDASAPSPISKWPFKAHWSGFPAWLTWLVVHIFFLIGFRNRLAVFPQWVWTYLTLRTARG